MNDWVVEAKNITKVYEMGDVQVHALRGLSLQIAKGEIIAIMGPSGSGKSTLMNILGCLDRPSSGEYFLDGESVATLNDDQLARIRNQKVGFVFQSFNRSHAQRRFQMWNCLSAMLQMDKIEGREQRKHWKQWGWEIASITVRMNSLGVSSKGWQLPVL